MSFFLMILLTACSTTNTPEIREREIRVEVHPPSYLTEECIAVRPEIPTAENVIISLRKALNNCNTRMKLIRERAEKQ